jgi:hypothetical protein
MLLSKNIGFMESDVVMAASDEDDGREIAPWTDDYANVLAALRVFTE